MVRLKDIAARAGVSVMTVSKALRDASDISAASKERIKRLAREMGYVPDSMAQSLRSRTTKVIGLIVPAMTNPTLARVVLGIEERAHDLGYDLLLAQTLNRPEREENVLRRFISRRVDGLLIFPVYRMASAAPVYDDLLARRIPTVILGHRAAFCGHFPNVEVDDLLASYHLTKYLISLGHRRIAYFRGPPSAPPTHERLEGYRRALREAQIPVDDSLFFNAGNTIEEGEKAALQYLNELPKATALQTFNDMVAIGAANTLLNQGIRIPKDISVAGFGNILTSEYFRVPLTTVRQPKLRLGVAAIDLLIKLIRGEPFESKRLSAEVITRASTGPIST
jgi:DNA-binding LacI/PurR family transcriptional regulator